MGSEGQVGEFGGYPIYSVSREIDNANRAGVGIDAFLGKANSFSCSVGPEPGRGYLLMRRGDVLDLIDQMSYMDPPVFPLTLGYDRDGYNVTLPGITLVKATSVYGRDMNNDDSIMLVEVADRRIFASSEVITRMYNWKCVTGSHDERFWAETLFRRPGTTLPPTTTTPSPVTTLIPLPTTCPPTRPNPCEPWTWLGIFQDLWCYVTSFYSNSMYLPSDVPLPYWTVNLANGINTDWYKNPVRILISNRGILQALADALRLYGGLVLCYDPVYESITIELCGTDNSYVGSVIDNYRSQLIYTSGDVAYISSGTPSEVQVCSFVRLTTYSGGLYGGDYRYPFVEPLCCKRVSLDYQMVRNTFFPGYPNEYKQSASFIRPRSIPPVYYPVESTMNSPSPPNRPPALHTICQDYTGKEVYDCPQVSPQYENACSIPYNILRLGSRLAVAFSAPWSRRSIYAGCIPIPPSSRSTTVTWKDYGGGFVTEVLYVPENILLAEPIPPRIPREMCVCPTTPKPPAACTNFFPTTLWF